MWLQVVVVVVVVVVTGIYLFTNNAKTEKEIESRNLKQVEVANIEYGMITQMKESVMKNGDKEESKDAEEIIGIINNEIDGEMKYDYPMEQIKYENAQESTSLYVTNINIEEFNDCNIHNEKETHTIQKSEIFPILPHEIVTQRTKVMEYILETNKLTNYEEKIVHTINKQFELLKFRSPNLQEIASILTKTAQKMKEEEDTQNIVALNEEKTMLDYLEFNDINQLIVSKQSNSTVIVDDLLSKMEARGFHML